MTPRWDTVLRGLCWWEKEIEENRANSFFGRQSKKSLPRAPPLSERIRTASRIWMQNQQVALTKQNTSSINDHLSSRLILINNTTWYYLRKIISCTAHPRTKGHGRTETVHMRPKFDHQTESTVSTNFFYLSHILWRIFLRPSKRAF